MSQLKHKKSLEYQVKFIMQTTSIRSVTPFLFQLNAHNMWNTHIFHLLPPTFFSVCYTIFRETIALLAQEMYAFCNVAKMYNIPSIFKSAMLLQSLKQYYFFLLYLKSLKKLIKS